MLKAKLDKDTTKRKEKKKKDNYWSISMKNINAKIFDKIIANLIHQYIKRIIHPNQVEFTQGGKDGSIYRDQSLKYLTLTNSRIKIMWSSQ